MEQKLRILYSDESGDLNIKGIGKCDIYVFNDGYPIKVPYFWVISKDKSIILNFRLDKEYLYDNYYYEKSYGKYSIIGKLGQKKIYSYIKNRLDDNGDSKWNNMIHNYSHYFDIHFNYDDDDEYRTTIIEHHSVVLDLGERLGKSELKITDQFADHPTIRIHSFNTKFIGYISMLTGKYFGGDKLTEDEFKVINEYMRTRPNFHNKSHGYTLDDNTSNWYFILLDFIVNYVYLDKYIVERCIKYTDKEYQIPKFNIEEYYIDIKIEDYINNLLKGEQ